MLTSCGSAQIPRGEVRVSLCQTLCASVAKLSGHREEQRGNGPALGKRLIVGASRQRRPKARAYLECRLENEAATLTASDDGQPRAILVGALLPSFHLEAKQMHRRVCPDRVREGVGPGRKP